MDAKIPPSQLDRRGFVGSLAAGAAGAFALGAAADSPAAPARRPNGVARARTLRFAHFTDIHLFAERNAPAGFEAALRHVQAAPQSAELIVTGGDLIFDSSETALGVARDRWDLLTRMLKEHCRLPLEHCLGNHDVWGWCKTKCGSNGTESEYGTALARSQLGLNTEWRSFDRAGWHFIVLNSISPDPNNECGYLALLSDPQRAWLEKDLAATTLPTVVVSHAPIVSVTPLMHGSGYRGKDNRGTISGGLMHLDAQPIHQLFRTNRRVKLVLSGHMHLIDRCEADGVTYCCDGAVCGGWWKADPNHAPPCYGLVDLFDDGSFEHRVVEYGWKNA